MSRETGAPAHRLVRALCQLAALAACGPLSSATPIAGPYYIVVDHVEGCPASLLDVPFAPNFRIVRNRQQPQYLFLSANFTLNRKVEDETAGEVVVSSWSSRGGWKDNAVIFKFKRICLACATYVPALLRETQSKTRGPDGPLWPGHPCNYKVGPYSVHNVTSATYHTTAFPALFYGRWRFDAKLFGADARSVVGCVRAFVQIIPRMQPARPSPPSPAAHG